MLTEIFPIKLNAKPTISASKQTLFNKKKLPYSQECAAEQEIRIPELDFLTMTAHPSVLNFGKKKRSVSKNLATRAEAIPSERHCDMAENLQNPFFCKLIR